MILPSCIIKALATYYGTNPISDPSPTLLTPGACGPEYIYTNYVALTYEIFDTYTPSSNPNLNTLCGQCISISRNNRTIKSIINDRLPSREEGGIDLNYPQLLELEPNIYELGIVPVSWQFINC